MESDLVMSAITISELRLELSKVRGENFALKSKVSELTEELAMEMDEAYEDGYDAGEEAERSAFNDETFFEIIKERFGKKAFEELMLDMKTRGYDVDV